MEWSDATKTQIYSRIYDKKYFVARNLSKLSADTGLEVQLLAQTLIGVLVVILLTSPIAHFLTNLLLIAYPLLVIYVHPEEKPSNSHLHIYWGCFGLLSLFDRLFEYFFGYYVIKIGMMLFLFLEPYRLVDSIEAILNENLKSETQLSEMTMPTSIKSPANSTEKTQSATLTAPSESTTTAKPFYYSPQPTKRRTNSMKTSRETRITRVPLVDIQPAPPSTQQPPSDDSSKVVRSHQMRVSALQPPKESTSLVDVKGRVRFKGINPMIADQKFHTISPQCKETQENEMTSHDLVFVPREKIVFNAPFDYENITYHMRIVNISTNKLAFAVKGNAVPRVVAFPPSGLISPGEKIIVAVTMRKFDFNTVDYKKDRIVFEYVIVKKDVTKFNYSLLQEADMKNRTNIYVKYNR